MCVGRTFCIYGPICNISNNNTRKNLRIVLGTRPHSRQVAQFAQSVEHEVCCVHINSLQINSLLNLLFNYFIKMFIPVVEEAC